MISFGQFVFESPKPKILCDFLCFVFDLDFEATAADSFVIDFFGLKVLIIPCEKISTKKSGCVLHAASVDELDQLRQKIEFFFYKNQIKVSPPLLFGNELRFNDTDGRAWFVDLPVSMLTRKVEFKSQDVR